MPASRILDFEAKITKADVSAANQAFNGLAKNFEKQVGTALDSALKSGLDEKHLAKFEKRAQKIQYELLAARTKEERKAILAKEKSWKGEFSHIKEVTKRRKRAQQDLGSDMEGRFAKATQSFGRGLSSTINDVMSANIKGLGDKLSGLGKHLRKAGIAKQGKQGTGIFGTLSRAIGGATKALGGFAIGAGVAVAGLGAIVAAISKVIDHGAKLNKTLLTGGSSFGDLADSTKPVHEALRDVRKAFTDVGRNLEWLQTTEEQLKIVGAFNAAGFTIKEMNKGLATSAERITAYRKAVETATTYSRLLGMEATEVAEKMSDYMSELGLSLDGIRARFAEVYDVAQASGFGTKRFFGMVLQATSGMAMYNVRLNETAGLLLQLSKMMGRKRAEALVQEGGGGRPTTVKEATVATMKRGKGLTTKLVKGEAEKTGRELIRRLEESGMSAKRTADILAKSGIKVDMSSAAGLVKSMGKMTSEARINMIAALKEANINKDVIRQFETSFDLMKGAVSGKLTDVAIASSEFGPATQILADIKAVNAVIPKSLEKMSGVELMGYQEMTGFDLKKLKELKSFIVHTKANHQILSKIQKDQRENGKRYVDMSIEERKEFRAGQAEQIEKYGFFIDDQGDRIIANTPSVLDMDPDALDEYKKQNKIGDDLLSFQQNQGAAYMQATEEVLDRNLEKAIEIARNTEGFGKVLEIGVEYILNEIYEVLVDFFSVFLSKDPKEREARDKALRLVKEQRRAQMIEAKQNLKKLDKLNKQLDKLPKDSAKRAALEEKKTAAELKEKGLKVGQAETERMAAAATGVTFTGQWERLEGAWLKGEDAFLKEMHQIAGGFDKTIDEMKAVLGEEKVAALEEATRKRVMRAETEEAYFAAKSGRKAKLLDPEAIEALVMQRVNEQLVLLTGGIRMHGEFGEAGTTKGMTRGAALRMQAGQKVEYTEYARHIGGTMEQFSKSLTHYSDRVEKISGAITRVGKEETAAGGREALSKGLKGTTAEQAEAIVHALGLKKGGPQAMDIMAKAIEGKGDLTPEMRKKLGGGKIEELRALGLSETAAATLAPRTKASPEEKDFAQSLKYMAYMTEEELDRYVKDSAEEEREKPREKQYMTNMFLTKQPDKWGEVLRAELDRQERLKTRGALAAAGFTGTRLEEATKALFEGGPSAEVAGELVEKSEFLKERLTGDALERLMKMAPSAGDFIWRPGQPLTRVSGKDVISGVKEKAGGGGRVAGGGPVINHFYNDAKSFLANQAQMKRAMTGYA